MPFSLVHTQESFGGGMNLLSLDTFMKPDEYKIGFNLRSRFGYVKPVKVARPIMDGLPDDIGRILGFYAFGDILVLFTSLRAYYKPDSSDVWTEISGFGWRTNATRVYVCAVPAASLQYLRKNITLEVPSSGVTLDNSTVTGSPIALVVQDGENQPRLIFPDGTSRQAHIYSQWTPADREYVPIGRQMTFFNGILFVVAADGKHIYRSVSGRPLDFVVAVDNNGDAITNAEATSFAVDSNEIKLLTQLNTNSLIVMTSYSAYAVQLNFESQIYDEPTFNQRLLFTAGVTNQFSFTDILGDFAFIDKEGIKSFNAVSQLLFEGNNGVFSLSVAELFNNIVQSDPCVGSFDNYTFFGVKTIYSDNSILVYDNIQKVFVSIDLLVNEPIRQFASSYTTSTQRFYVATTTTIYELYSPDETEFKAATLFLRGYDTRNTDQGPTKLIGELQSQSLRFLFEESPFEGLVNVTEISDDKVTPKRWEKTIYTFTGPVYYPVQGPCIATMLNGINNIAIPTGREAKMGQKVTYAVIWTGGAKLTRFQLNSSSETSPTSLEQSSKVYASN